MVTGVNATVHLNLDGAPYVGATLQPIGPLALFTIDAEDGMTVQIKLTGQQFEMLRNIFNDYANHGQLMHAYSALGIIHPATRSLDAMEDVA